MDISESLTYHITKTGNILRQLTAKRLKEAGIDLTPEEAVLMNQLWDKSPQTVSELGAWSVKDPSTVTRQIDGLVKKGYLQRNHGESDRRKVFVSLTTAGRKLEKDFQKTGISNLDQDLAHFSKKDLYNMLDSLMKIRSNALQEFQKS